MFEHMSNAEIWELTGWIALFCLMPVISRVMRDQRRTAFEKAAMALGFNFDEEGRTLPTEILSSLPVFNIGDSREVSNLMYKAAGAGTMYVFEYSYHAQGPYSHKGRNHHIVVVFPSSGNLPQFQLSPELLRDKVKQLFGYQDIDFADSPEFSKKYLLRGPDEEAVRKVFSVEARNLLSAMKDWHVEGAGAWLAMFRPGVYVGPEHYQDHIKQAGDISSVFGGPRA